MITTTKTNYDSIGAYVWDRYETGDLDLVWAGDAEYAHATMGRWVIDPYNKTVYRFANEDDALSYAYANGGPGSEDYFITTDYLKEHRAGSVHVVLQGDRLVAVSLEWEDLAPAIFADMEEQGVYGNVFLDYSWQPEMVILDSSANKANKLVHFDPPTPEYEWQA